MARHYSVKDFFRQTPNALLGRSFAARGLFTGLNFSAMEAGKPIALFDGWRAFPDKERRRTDADFRDNEEMGEKAGGSSEVVEMALNQVIGGVRGEYDLAGCETRRRKMLQIRIDDVEQLIATGQLAPARFKQGARPSKPRLFLGEDGRVSWPGWRRALFPGLAFRGA